MMYCKIRRLELLRSGQLSDCELHVRNTDGCQRPSGRKFRVHKAILASASSEFQRMISSPEFERNKRVLVVDDASAEAYEALLLYFYTYEICSAIQVDIFNELLQLSVRYNTPDFIDAYISKLATQDLPMDKVMQIFQVANTHNRPDIMKLLGEKIEPVALQVLADNSFLRLNIRQLKVVIGILRSLGTVPDNQLLMALKKYQNCNNVGYGNMQCFLEFVEVTNMFGDMLFEPDGTLIVIEEHDDEVDQPNAERAESVEKIPSDTSKDNKSDSA